MDDEDPDYDALEAPFENDATFRKLLKNRTFNDYLNTFLSLPVFSVRVLYRRDNDTFELEQEIPRSQHHLVKVGRVIDCASRSPLSLKRDLIFIFYFAYSRGKSIFVVFVQILQNVRVFYR